MATVSIFCKKKGLLFCLKPTISLTFLWGAIKRALGGFTGVSEQFRDLMPDKRIFSVYNSGMQSLLFKIKKSYFNMKAALKVFN